MKHTPPQFLIDERGKKIAVIIKMMDYHEMIEDLHDFRLIEKRKKEKNISFERMKAKLKI
ncbi:hypothetical protein HYV58_01550 [Candidatus Peregrinibacteria bacterium]|nr:hypothetical protein [Candidatus Peregrinibacteria bacterium]